MNNCIQRIKEYLHDDSVFFPLLVNIENHEQKFEIYDYCNVGGNTVIRVADFAKPDGIPNVMALIDRIKKSQNNTFVFELTTYLRLLGNKELENTLETLSEMSIHCKAVIICYHCEDILKALIQKDLRIAQRVVTVDRSEEMKKPKVIFVRPDHGQLFTSAKEGIEYLADALEACEEKEVYIKTTKNQKIFEKGAYAISTIDNSLQILQKKYPELKSFEFDKQDSYYWDYLLSISKGKETLKSIVIDQFGNNSTYEFALQEWGKFSDNKQWLLYIAMKVFPDAKNQIIRQLALRAQAHTLVQR